MHQILNTLYVMTQGSYLRLDHETLKVEVEGKSRLQVPLHHLGGIVCFGNVMASPFLIHRCMDDGRSFVFLSSNGRFKGRIKGPVSGNVLLRRAQHNALDVQSKVIAIAKNILAGKVQNARIVIMRSAREATDTKDAEDLRQTATKLSRILIYLEKCGDLNKMRGLEGEAGRVYFQTFTLMVRQCRQTFAFERRTRRPPRDPINCLLSFLYTLLRIDCEAALEGVGLDPQVGFLHTLRPGRPALALDLMEELRAVVADRLALTLVNRKQVTASSFVERPGGAVHLDDEGRREVVIAYQKRKQVEVVHPLLKQKIPLGLIPNTQARLLARHLRGDTNAYLPYIQR